MTHTHTELHVPKSCVKLEDISDPDQETHIGGNLEKEFKMQARWPTSPCKAWR